MTVTALLLSCEACGVAVRIARDDPESFCLFVNSHRMPVVDAAETDDGRFVEVMTR